MPLGTYYQVTGNDPANLDIQRLVTPQRATRARVDDEDVPLMRDQYEQVRKEYDNALAIFEARMKNIRPWETPEQLQSEIIKPIADKWRQVPGFQGSSGIEIERMRQSQEAKNAAQKLVQQGAVEQDREAFKAAGDSDTQATIKAALRNNIGSRPAFKFPGFFYSGKNDDLDLSVARGAWGDARAAAEAEWNRKHPPAKQETPSVASVPVYDPSGKSIPGVYAVPAASGKGFTIHNVPAERTAKETMAPLAEFQLDLKKDELKELRAERDKFKSLLPEGEMTEEAIAKMQPITKSNYLKFKNAEQRIEALKREIELLYGVNSSTNAPSAAAPKTFQSGKYRVTIKK